ncbi:putative quinol monooxygenase [Geminicoccus flavidas]|uniref:putative quinol monooxygenase n=1 Tax=Geminicoccus flavidas TaxID=2506407 RepID=UPI00135B197F|nr:putative quinol monooxygenase [Geminicoccus flavidas]
MSPFIIIVEFVVAPADTARFRQLMVENAARSLADEPGCRQFDVCNPVGEQERFILYEIYDDEAAFQAHVRSPHFLKFDAAVAGMVLRKTVTQLELLEQPACAAA